MKLLGVTEPVKVYVGTQVEQMLAVKVLEFSIHKHTRQSVEVIPLFEAVESAGINIPVPRSPRLYPRTPFSFQRFTIPQLNGYEGRAIYLDSDMQVFRDINELWSWDFEGADLLSVYEPPNSGRLPQFSVMVLNCQQLRWNVIDLIKQLEAGRWNYKQFILEMAPAGTISPVLPTEWNDLERFTEGKTALTHYTDMDTQPWLSIENPLASLWCRDLLEAITVGFIDKDYVKAEVKKGYVRPSLLYQVEYQVADPSSLPKDIIQKDHLIFVPPHQRGSLTARAKEGGFSLSLLTKVVKKLYSKSLAFLDR